MDNVEGKYLIDLLKSEPYSVFDCEMCNFKQFDQLRGESMDIWRENHIDYRYCLWTSS